MRCRPIKFQKHSKTREKREEEESRATVGWVYINITIEPNDLVTIISYITEILN